MKYLQIQLPAPVLNTPDFQAVFGGARGNQLPLDPNGHPQAYEFVALPETTFPIERKISDNIIESIWRPYSDRPLYLDIRFGQILSTPPKEIKKTVPDAKTLLSRMESKLGTPYVWGGNWSPGIPEILKWYPPKEPLSERIKTLWTLAGLDCSGLLYECSQGTTPRNTHQLIHFGTPLPLSKLKLDEAIARLQPLDMILYPGHVLFVRNQETVIESKSPFGVRLYPIRKRLEELLSERHLVDDWTADCKTTPSFIIRRFSKHNASDFC